jgi:hypothetical protein
MPERTRACVCVDAACFWGCTCSRLNFGGWAALGEGKQRRLVSVVLSMVIQMLFVLWFSLSEPSTTLRNTQKKRLYVYAKEEALLRASTCFTNKTWTIVEFIIMAFFIRS